MSDRATPIAKALRRRLTDTERRLWTQLRAHRLARWKFKRQQPIGPYIVDNEALLRCAAFVLPYVLCVSVPAW
mgnify:FL=1